MLFWLSRENIRLIALIQALAPLTHWSIITPKWLPVLQRDGLILFPQASVPHRSFLLCVKRRFDE